MENMSRYPEDRLGIYQSLKGLGKHHGQFIELLIEPLLATLHVDLRFLGKTHSPSLFLFTRPLIYFWAVTSTGAELHVEDSTYVGLAIAILNAGAANTNILHLLPPFILRHHRYFRDKYPALFPASLPSTSSPTSTFDDSPLASVTLSSSSSSSSTSSAAGAEDTTLFFSEVICFPMASSCERVL